MSSSDDMAERHGRVLAELTELGLSLARALHDKAVTAEDPKLANDYALAFQRVSRSVRQSMALEAKLERDRRRAAAEARDYPVSRAAEQARELARAVFVRKAEVRSRLRSELWDEYENLDDAAVEATIAGDIEREAALETFLAEPAGEQVERLLAALRAVLDASAAGADAPACADAAPPWHSSA